ncbi:MAG: motility protein A, partial [Candidatus Contubernalis sp.]|nr:motility protein A [Candidatus Contubernalis sp.]
MKRMDLLTVIGMVLGVVLVVGAIVVQGELIMFWSPHAIMITIGGSFSALLIKFQLEQVRMV